MKPPPIKTGIEAFSSHEDDDRDLLGLRRLLLELLFRVLGFLGIECGWLTHR